MANYNLAHGGDPHYNANYALYPQNALIDGRPEFGDSQTVLKPAHHWMGGVYKPTLHQDFNDECHQCATREVAQKIKAGDTMLTHVIPGLSLLTDFVYRINRPVEVGELTVRMAGSGLVLGTIDATEAGCGWFTVDPTDPLAFVHCDTNDGIEIVFDSWPDNTPEPADSDPCDVFGPCEKSVNFCWDITAMYKNPAMEQWCEETCYDTCGC